MTSEQRIVVSARMIGVVHRDMPKLKVFMLSVMWSDHTEVIIYRSFKDFKTLHRGLKKRFPRLNPFDRKNRVIPKFRGEARKSSRSQKGPKRFVQRMKFLNNYCDQLLKCDQNVTQSSEVTQFFHPKDHDLQPDFTKNSVMILLSDDQSAAGGADVTHQTAGSVTHPFVTQTYRCVAAYETKDTKNRPFKAALDEKLDVLIKDPAGWWLVENEEKHLAWFPAPYLELWEGEEDEDTGLQLGGTLYCAVKSYSTKKDDEVSVAIGCVVEVLRKSDNGWWLIRSNGKAGYIPSMYLKPYNNPRAGLYSLQRTMHSSTLNLATNRETQSSSPSSISEENSPQEDSDGQPMTEPSVPGRLHKARSLDVLSETWSTLPEQASSSYSRGRSRTSTSTESSFSSDSESSSSSGTKEDKSGLSRPGLPEASVFVRRDSDTSSEASGSGRSTGSDTASVAPKVPPRPKTEEILTRCTTMTRKAALATRTRLQIQPDSTHSR
ncbi:NADPH oxidase organizer 1-like [Sphaeramia orbicularis]|uniref:NADPH oxidase organizer 1-like n=1 Tax=Sphaeramia orbicularis TaxID=375764 RepID=UPI00117E4071|nr:NADPH oxidase organizer 1-like [Sphaeramia orbicularis]